MALYEREHTGKGQIIDFSVTDSISYIKQVADRSKLKIPDEFHRFAIDLFNFLSIHFLDFTGLPIGVC